MKPLDGTFAQNAQRHGVAGMNIDRCRIPCDYAAEYGEKCLSSGADKSLPSADGRQTCSWSTIRSVGKSARRSCAVIRGATAMGVAPVGSAMWARTLAMESRTLGFMGMRLCRSMNVTPIVPWEC